MQQMRAQHSLIHTVQQRIGRRIATLRAGAPIQATDRSRATERACDSDRPNPTVPAEADGCGPSAMQSRRLRPPCSLTKPAAYLLHVEELVRLRSALTFFLNDGKLQ